MFVDTLQRLEMLHGHSKNSEFIQPARHGVTGRNHGRQLVYQIVHLVSAALLDLAVGLPVDTGVEEL